MTLENIETKLNKIGIETELELNTISFEFNGETKINKMLNEFIFVGPNMAFMFDDLETKSSPDQDFITLYKSGSRIGIIHRTK